jgi:hypothetical protein
MKTTTQMARLQMTDETGSYTWTNPKTGEQFSVRRVHAYGSQSYTARGNRGTVVYAERLADMRARLPAT